MNSTRETRRMVNAAQQFDLEMVHLLILWCLTFVRKFQGNPPLD